MDCPLCGFDSTKVVDSRLTEPRDAVRRRRECEGCGQRFTTYERSESLPLVVIKRGGARERTAGVEQSHACTAGAKQSHARRCRARPVR